MFCTDVKNSSVPFVNENKADTENKDCDNSNLEKNCFTTQAPSKSILVNTDLDLKDIIEIEKREILEKNQILSLQQKRFKPISSKMFLLMRLLMLIFPVNLIILLIWSFGKNTNLNRKAFARSTLLFYAIVTISTSAIIISLVVLGYPVNPVHWLNKIGNLSA